MKSPVLMPVVNRLLLKIVMRILKNWSQEMDQELLSVSILYINLFTYTHVIVTYIIIVMSFTTDSAVAYTTNVPGE